MQPLVLNWRKIWFVNQFHHTTLLDALVNKRCVYLQRRMKDTTGGWFRWKSMRKNKLKYSAQSSQLNMRIPCAYCCHTKIYLEYSFILYLTAKSLNAYYYQSDLCTFGYIHVRKWQFINIWKKSVVVKDIVGMKSNKLMVKYEIKNEPLFCKLKKEMILFKSKWTLFLLLSFLERLKNKVKIFIFILRLICRRFGNSVYVFSILFFLIYIWHIYLKY